MGQVAVGIESERVCVMTTLAHRSTWLSSALYHSGYLTLFLLDGTALLYANVPSYIPGLLSAHRSPGRAYNLLVKGKHLYQRLNAAQAREIKEMIR